MSNSTLRAKTLPCRLFEFPLGSRIAYYYTVANPKSRNRTQNNTNQNDIEAGAAGRCIRVRYAHISIMRKKLQRGGGIILLAST